MAENITNFLVPGKAFSFYANLDTLETSANFSNWVLHLLNEDDFEIAYPNIGTLTKDTISGNSFRFYSQFITPSDLTEGKCYVLAVYETDTTNIKYLSNTLQVKAATYSEMINIRYRNDKNILNFNYETLTNFYNRFWIHLATIQPQNPTVRTGYDLVSGAFKEIRSTSGKNKRFITRAYTDEDHEAFNAATIHNTFQIAENGQWTTYTRPTDADYAVDWVDEFNLAHGEITLEKDSTFASSKAI